MVSLPSAGDRSLAIPACPATIPAPKPSGKNSRESEPHSYATTSIIPRRRTRTTRAEGTVSELQSAEDQDRPAQRVGEDLHRLQGHRVAAENGQRQREDPLAQAHRRDGHGAANDRASGEAGAIYGAVALRHFRVLRFSLVKLQQKKTHGR